MRSDHPRLKTGDSRTSVRANVRKSLAITGSLPNVVLNGYVLTGASVVVRTRLLLLAVLITAGLATAATPADSSESNRQLVLDREQQRIELILRLAPSVVCIYDENRRGGGSGVIIDPQGYGLTNFHVVAGMMKKRQGSGGLNDGKLYDLDILGVDPTGDVAMFRLTGLDSFPFAQLGESESLAVGDSVIAMGNPFVLSEDYAPTVTLGIITGLHRYQWGTGTNLVYSDCIQIDAPINPGSSGGPLFDMQGRVVGINGRISINTRGRFNVGFGYAITVDQIKRFIPALRAGLLAKHGTLQATVEDMENRGVVFTELLRNASAYNAGLRVGDRLLELDGIPINSRNHFASLIGTYPAGWPVRVRVERTGIPEEFTTRLESVLPKLSEPFQPDEEVNRRHVEYILSRYRGAVFGKNTAAPQRRSWRVKRETAPTDAGSAPSIERFEGTIGGSGPATLRQIHEDGRKGRVIEFNDSTATSRSSPEAEPMELPFDMKLTANARFVGLHTLLSEPSADNLAAVHHVGGDTVGPGAPPLWFHNTEPASSMPKSRILEVLQYPLAENVDARFGFDSETFLLARIILRDLPTGAETTIDLTDWSDAGGFLMPHKIYVRGSGRKYHDELSDWEVTP